MDWETHSILLQLVQHHVVMNSIWFWIIQMEWQRECNWWQKATMI